MRIKRAEAISGPGGVVCVLAACLLCGCGASYRVEIQNNSGRRLLARIVRDRAFDSDQVLGQAFVSDGEMGELGPVDADALEPVSVRVSRPGDIGDLPEDHRLRRGYNAFVVEAGSSEDWSGFVVRRVE